ncbi:MAG: hypothetical protein AAF393_06360 [Pseudomonadota bacterium]
MTDRFDIPADEHGVVRVFEAIIDDAAVQRQFLEDDRWATFLTVTADGSPVTLDDAYVDLIRPADLKGVGLSRYLMDGVGIAEDALAEGDASRLDRIKRPVAVMLSKAFQGQAVALNVAAPFIWVGTYGEVRATPVQSLARDVGGHVHAQTAPTEERPGFLNVALYLGLIFAALFGVVLLLGLAKT